MFGLVNKGDLDALESRLNSRQDRAAADALKNATPDIIRSVKQQLTPSTVLELSTTEQVTLDEVITRVLAQLAPMVQQHLTEAVENIDVGAIADRLYNDTRIEEIEDGIADKLRDQVYEALDLNRIAEVIAEKIVDDDYLNMSEVEEQIANTVSDRMVINLRPQT